MSQLIVDGVEVPHEDPSAVKSILRATQMQGGVSVCPRKHMFTGPKCRECWETLQRFRKFTEQNAEMYADAANETRAQRAKRYY